MPSAFVAVTPTHATSPPPTQICTNELISQTLRPGICAAASCRLTRECRPFLAISHPCSVLTGTNCEQPHGNNRCARLDGRCCAPSVGPTHGAHRHLAGVWS